MKSVSMERASRTVCRITAHAGCMGTPMDSLEAIEAGVASGADIVEVDVRFLPDGTPFLAHNEDVVGDTAVRLADALALLGRLSDQVCINIDIKDSGALHNLTQIAELARAHLSVGTSGGKADGRSRAFLTGLGEDACASRDVQNCGLRYYVNTDFDRVADPTSEEAGRACARAIGVARKTGALGLNFHLCYATEGVLSSIRANGLLSSVWTVNDPGEIARIARLGADNITTRIPDRGVSVRDAL